MSVISQSAWVHTSISGLDPFLFWHVAIKPLTEWLVDRLADCYLWHYLQVFTGGTGDWYCHSSGGFQSQTAGLSLFIPSGFCFPFLTLLPCVNSQCVEQAFYSLWKSLIGLGEMVWPFLRPCMNVNEKRSVFVGVWMWVWVCWCVCVYVLLSFFFHFLFSVFFYVCLLLL